MIDEQFKEFFWAATLWHRKADELAYAALMNMRINGPLNPKIANRIAQIEHEHETKNRSDELRPPSIA